MTDEEDCDIGNNKYHSAQVVALRSGRLALCGTFNNNGTGIPVLALFDNFQDLHSALMKFQEDSRAISHEIWSKPTVQFKVSLESLGLAKPMKRRSLNGQRDA